MTRDELLKHHELICKSAQDLMNLKNRDYAGNGGKEPFANFTRCESLGVCTTEQGMLVRVVDKISRLSSFIEAGKMSVENELLSPNDPLYNLNGTSSSVQFCTDVMGPITVVSSDPTLSDTAYGLFADLVRIASQS